MIYKSDLLKNMCTGSTADIFKISDLSTYKFFICVNHKCYNSVHRKWLSLCAEVRENERRNIVFSTSVLLHTHNIHTNSQYNLLSNRNFKLINVHRRVLRF